MSKTTNSAKLIGVVAAAGLALTACSGSSDTSAESQPTKTVTAKPKVKTKTVTATPKVKTKTVTAKPKHKKSSSESSSSEGTSSDSSSGDGTAPLKGNSTYKFEDGVTVKLVEGSTHTVSQSDAEAADGQVHAGDKYMLYEFKVTNNTGSAMDTAAVAGLRYGETGKSAEQIVTDATMDNDMDGRVQPHHSATGEYAFAVNPQAKKVVLDFDPDMQHQVSFVGK
jgi:hypothetical protein